jgi:hypothetical protein
MTHLEKEDRRYSSQLFAGTWTFEIGVEKGRLAVL